jgi:antitoxin MazE
MTVRVQKWGNSLGVRIPQSIARQSAIRSGTELDVSFRNGRVVLQPIAVPSLKTLLDQMKPANRPELVDWGKPRGQEAW